MGRTEQRAFSRSGSRWLAAWLTTVTVVFAIACTGPAWAGSKEDKARTLYKAAKQDFEARNFEAALEKLREAHSIYPKAIIQLKMSEALENLGRIEEAYEALMEASGDDKKIESKIQSARRRMEVQLSKPVPVSVLTGQVPGARILIDGKDTGLVTPAVLKIPRGKRALRIEKEGYRPYEDAGLEVRGMDTIVVDVRLAPWTGRLKLRLSSGTFESVEVTVDGKVLPGVDPKANSLTVELQLGDHDVVCRGPDGEVYRRTIGIGQDLDTPLTCKVTDMVPEVASEASESVESSSSVLPMVMLLSGGGFILGGTGLFVWHTVDQAGLDAANATSKPGTEQRKQGCGGGGETEGVVPCTLDEAFDRQLVGGIVVGVGVAALAGGLVMWLMGDGETPAEEGEGESEAEDEVVLSPQFSPLPEGGGFFGLSGSF